jgi:hypothetical protein
MSMPGAALSPVSTVQRRCGVDAAKRATIRVRSFVPAVTRCRTGRSPHPGAAPVHQWEEALAVEPIDRWLSIAYRVVLVVFVVVVVFGLLAIALGWAPR